MKDFAGKFVLGSIGVWIADWYLPGFQVGTATDRWPMKLAVILLLGLLLTAVSAMIKPIIGMLNMPAMMITVMLIWAVIGTFALWLLAQLARALALPFFLSHFWWQAVIAALIIGWWISLMEYVTPPIKK